MDFDDRDTLPVFPLLHLTCTLHAPLHPLHHSPWCYVGKKHLDAVVANVSSKVDVDITWHQPRRHKRSKA